MKLELKIQVFFYNVIHKTLNTARIFWKFSELVKSMTIDEQKHCTFNKRDF